MNDSKNPHAASGTDASTPPSSTVEPSFWGSTDSTPADPPASGAAPVDADQPRPERRGGRSWIWASLIMSALAVIGGVVLPHFAAFLALISVGSAWLGVRFSTGTPKLGVGALIASIIVFVACVVYTIVSVQAGLTYIETVQ